MSGRRMAVPPLVRAVAIAVAIFGREAPGISTSVVESFGGKNSGGASTAAPPDLDAGSMPKKLLPRLRGHEAVSTDTRNSKATALETEVMGLDATKPFPASGVSSSVRRGMSKGRGRRASTSNTGRMREDDSLNPGCPYAVPTEKEALSRGHSSSDPGNVIEVTSFEFARMGNRFIALYRTLTLGFCCKSKMVTLPPKDDILAPGIFNDGTPGPRWFDFSGAPDVAGFNASSCPPTITWGRRDSFFLTGLDEQDHPYYTPGLRKCLYSVKRLIECEAMYYFPMDIDVCSSLYNHNNDDDTDRDGDGGMVEAVSSSEEEEEGESGNEKGKNTPAKLVVHVRDDDIGIDGDRGMIAAVSSSEEEEGEDAEKDGDGKGKNTSAKLVIHVRSGDIFADPVHPGYGQFYLRVLHEQKWDRVDIVTNGYTDSAHQINPVIPVLQSRVAAGDLPGNIHFHKYRSMAEDLTSLVCADALATARSTVWKFLAYHATATQIYVPADCSASLIGLQNDRPHVKVYGMSWNRSDYSPYHGWKNTPDQLHEMMTFNVSGLPRCSSNA